MSLAKTKKKKRKRKLQAGSKTRPRKTSYELYSQQQINNFSRLIQHDAKIYAGFGSGTLVIGLDEVGRGCVAGPVCTGAYSCSTFYANPTELIEEVSRSRQLVSGEFINASEKYQYYSSTVINEGAIEEEIQEVEDLSTLLLLEDSKEVPHHKRESLCRSLLDVPSFNDSNHILYATNFQSAAKIDKLGIVQCIWNSMVENLVDIVLQHINIYNEYPQEIVLLVDGPKTIANLNESIKQTLKRQKINDLSFIELDANRDQSHLDLIEDTIIIRQINIVKGDGISAMIAAASNLAKQKRDQYMQNLSHKFSHYGWNRNVGYGTRRHLTAIESYGITKEHRKTFLEKYLVN